MIGPFHQIKFPDGTADVTTLTEISRGEYDYLKSRGGKSVRQTVLPKEFEVIVGNDLDGLVVCVVENPPPET